MRAPSYVWDAADRPCSVRLSLRLVRQLSHEASGTLCAECGVEMGGLLLGRIQEEDGFKTVSVDGYERMDPEHRRSRLYHPATGDFERLDETAVTHPDIVGFYRTHARGEVLTLDEEDTHLFRRYCAAPDCVFLLIEPASRRAGFFLIEDGKLFLAHQFPFDAAELEATGAVAAGDLPPAFRKSANARAIWTNPWMVRAAAVSAGFLLGGALWFQTHRFQTPRVAATPPVAKHLTQDLDLRVQSDGPGLRLFWNLASERVQHAQHGRLSIDDGAHHSQLNLSPKDLAVGSLAYWPESQSVAFRLELDAPEGPLTGAIRANGIQPPPAQVALVHEAAPPPPAPAEPEPPKPEPPKIVPQRISAGDLLDPDGALPEPKLSPFESRREEAKPEEAAAQPERAEAPARGKPNRTTAERSGPRTYVSVVAEPVTPSLLSRAVGGIPVVRRLKRKPSHVVPPSPVHQVTPVLTRAEQRRLRNTVPVNVKVHVGESGRVESAELMGRPPRTDRPVASAAVSAARQWRFTPARAGTENVPGDVILHFAFGSPPLSSQ